MKTTIAALVVMLTLTACTTPVPLVPRFPDVPEKLTEACPALKLIEGETTTLSTLTKVATENYTTYYQCAAKLDAWKKWYDEQKKIFVDLDGW
jgi:hypothetical protein